MWCPVYHINIIHIHGSSDKKYLDFLSELSQGNREQRAVVWCTDHVRSAVPLLLSEIVIASVNVLFDVM